MEILLGMILLLLLWKFGILGRVGSVLGNAAYYAAQSLEKAERAESFAREKYHGTRVVEVALKLWEDRGYGTSRFWYLSDNDREYHFRDARRQLEANPKSWGPFYRWKRKLQKSLYPLAWFLRYVNNHSCRKTRLEPVFKVWNIIGMFI